MLWPVITCMKPVLMYLCSVLAIHTYVATYICRALYNNAQIQLELQEYCLPLTRAWMWCAHYVQVLKEGLPLATDTAA